MHALALRSVLSLSLEAYSPLTGTDGNSPETS